MIFWQSIYWLLSHIWQFDNETLVCWQKLEHRDIIVLSLFELPLWFCIDIDLALLGWESEYVSWYFPFDCLFHATKIISFLNNEATRSRLISHLLLNYCELIFFHLNHLHICACSKLRSSRYAYIFCQLCCQTYNEGYDIILPWTSFFFFFFTTKFTHYKRFFCF